jgi:error-prone DNA polymerase
MDLLFERFLSEERGEWPDIDLDLPSGEQRERVIQYVYQRYGRHGAAMTANVITYRGRSAAREVGKVFGENRDHPKYRQMCEAIQDLPRHLGQHSGGMVVCQGQLDSVVPLEPAAMPGRVVVQWDKDDCADMGIIKVDLLGLGMMAVLEESLVHIRESYGEEVDLGRLPQNDPAVYQALQGADTVGMFQVESRAQMATLPRLKPRNFYDIVVEVGIIRPGPIVGKMVHPYIRRRQGKEKPECLHPSLEPVLQRTLGVPLFQEQLLRMAMIAAGFSGGEAEELRRAFSHKRSEQRMKEVEVKLRRGMDRNGITGATQDTIVHSITSFALYGFPESHAASFALLAYASAYLKVHYLAAFTAALLNNQPMGFYHPATIVKDAQRHGLRFLPVDVNHSGWQCTLEHPLPDGRGSVDKLSRARKQAGSCVRLGLNYLNGLRRDVALEIAARRPYSSLDDLALRVPALRKDELAKLAAAGALNSLARHRRDALWEAERAARPAGPLFEELAAAAAPSPLAPMTPEERVIADFRGTGLTIGRHPMAHRRQEWNRMGIRCAADLGSVPHGRGVRVAGSVIVRQRPGTAKGFVFLTLEDETGIANVIVAPGVFEATRDAVASEPYLLVEGAMQRLDGTLAVRARKILPLLGLATGSVSHDFH